MTLDIFAAYVWDCFVIPWTGAAMVFPGTPFIIMAMLGMLFFIIVGAFTFIKESGTTEDS